MLYGKIIDGVLIYAPPEIYKENGEVIILKTPSDYYDNGYKFVRRNMPEYDPMKEILVLDNIIDFLVIIVEKTIRSSYPTV